jgi:glycosyltransferase involved in cell wall biosynthesis
MNIYWIKKENVSTASALRFALESAAEGIVGIGSAEVIGNVSKEDASRWMQQADVVHAGLSFGSGEFFLDVQLCTFNWHFLNPSIDRSAVSWKATLDLAVLDKKLLQTIGTIDDTYESPDAALMDWVYRALQAGAKTIHEPWTLNGKPNGDLLAISRKDEMRFVCKHFNRRAQNFYRFCQFFLHGAWLPLQQINIISQPSPSESFKLTQALTARKVESYGALIPTIDRYAYITKSIDSLLTLKFPPNEIIVVDQTSKDKRKPEIYEPYQNEGRVKVIYLDQAGQCTARNRGLAEIKQPWVLLFEDDSEAWPDMVDEHVDLVERSGCDVSTGVIVPPGADRNFIPEHNRRYFLSDIFTTGNAFMKTETVWEVGGLDAAFDRGPGADDDFGKRLYQAGKTIVYNYKSVETHHKAPMGGMRVHGIWWRNTSTLFGPYPPVTQSFVILKYYPRKYRFFMFLNMILKARKKYSIGSYILFIFLLPYKLSISIIRARKLIKKA